MTGGYIFEVGSAKYFQILPSNKSSYFNFQWTSSEHMASFITPSELHMVIEDYGLTWILRSGTLQYHLKDI